MRYLIALLAACGSTPGSTTTPAGGQSPAETDVPSQKGDVATDLSVALRPLSWWLGGWRGSDGQEHWVAANGAIYGISLVDGGRWEVMIVDDAAGPGAPDGVVRFFAMPGGSKSVEFRAEKIDGDAVLFANPTHDAPKKIEYARTGDALRATLHADANRLITFDFTRTELPRAIELERADVAFSDQTRKRGIDAWMEAFDANGGMIRDGKRVTGAEIAEMMKPVFADGTLTWSPTESGIRGTIGFTVGKADFVGAKSNKLEWRSTYVTIWKQQPDKSWKVLFDVGRPVNEPLPADQ